MTTDADLAGAILETVRHPFVVLRDDLSVRLVNRAFTETFSVTSSEATGTYLHELGSGEWSVPELRDRLESSLRDDAPFEGMEITRVFPSLGRRILHLNGRRLRLAHGELILLGIEDVTERINARVERQRLTAELSRSNRELEEFAAAAAHDLQEPLRKIQAFGSRLRADKQIVWGETGLHFLDRMLNAADRMRLLIDALLAFARVRPPGEKVARVDLNEIARGVVGDLQHAIDDTSAEIAIAALPHYRADPAQMRQLFQNLLANSLKFRDSSRKLVITVRATATSIAGRRFLTLVIEDNGIGFEPQHAERIFRMFQRLQSAADYPGTGIGLALCRKIAEQHGGRITAESSPGEWSRFTVLLPDDSEEKH